jgi:hypothetical protein
VQRALLAGRIALVVALTLAWAPVWFQRKLVMGVHLPVCLLAAVGLADLAERCARGRRALRMALVALVLLASMPSHFWNARQLAAAVAFDPSAYYRAPAFERALRWLDREVEPDAVVLAHLARTRAIPGASGQFVSQGHWAQSVDFPEHRRWIASLFDPRSPLAPPRSSRRCANRASTAS